MTTRTAARSLLCDYEDGMFANEERDPAHALFARTFDRQAACYHEAAHAVAQYALGFGCSQISLKIFVVGATVAHGGEVLPNKAAHARVVRRLSNGPIGPALALGIALAAGPAAERKFCLASDVPFRTLFSAQGDHKNIDDVGWRLEASQRRGGMVRWAYQRFVWRRAQLALEETAIWRAVEELADALDEFWPDAEAEPGDDGDFCKTMSGATARAIMRRAGVVPGRCLRALSPA